MTIRNSKLSRTLENIIKHNINGIMIQRTFVIFLKFDIPKVKNLV
jgi:hypothetical protein